MGNVGGILPTLLTLVKAQGVRRQGVGSLSMPTMSIKGQGVRRKGVKDFNGSAGGEVF